MSYKQNINKNKNNKTKKKTTQTKTTNQNKQNYQYKTTEQNNKTLIKNGHPYRYRFHGFIGGCLAQGWMGKARKQELNRMFRRFLSTYQNWSHKQLRSLSIYTHINVYSQRVDLSSSFEVFVAKDMFMEQIHQELAEEKDRRSI